AKITFDLPDLPPGPAIRKTHLGCCLRQGTGPLDQFQQADPVVAQGQPAVGFDPEFQLWLQERLAGGCTPPACYDKLGLTVLNLSPFGDLRTTDNPALRRLVSERVACGPLTFRDFMATALYDARHGYYSSRRLKLGREGDF